MRSCFSSVVLCISLFWVIAGFGCASGRIGELPRVTDPERAAELIVVRRSAAVGAPVSYGVAINGKEVLALRSGTHAGFPIDSGDQVIQAWCLSDALGLSKKSTLRLPVQPGQTYYVEVSPGDAATCARVQRIEAAEGLRLVSETTALPLE